MSCLHWRRKFSTISSVILCCLPYLPWPPWAVLTDRIIPIHVAPHKVANTSTVVLLSPTFFANKLRQCKLSVTNMTIRGLLNLSSLVTVT
jgi:hypothetical protein